MDETIEAASGHPLRRLLAAAQTHAILLAAFVMLAVSTAYGLMPQT